MDFQFFYIFLSAEPVVRADDVHDFEPSENSDDIDIDIAPPAQSSPPPPQPSTSHANVDDVYKDQAMSSRMNFKLLEIFRQLNAASDRLKLMWNRPVAVVDETSSNRALMHLKVDRNLVSSTIFTDPTLMMYAESVQPYNEMSDSEKIALCIARLQVLNFKFEEEWYETENLLFRHESFDGLIACCSKCLQGVTPHQKLYAPKSCGHLLCALCSDSERCFEC